MIKQVLSSWWIFAAHLKTHQKDEHKPLLEATFHEPPSLQVSLQLFREESGDSLTE